VTAYSSIHANQQWTDGLSIGCENSLVAGNQVVDATDVGIVIFTQGRGIELLKGHQRARPGALMHTLCAINSSIRSFGT
jgi:hypothetical protein